MCGFAGYISNRIFNNNLISKLLNHRGPDNNGNFYENGSRTIKFFHNRLSIVDLSEMGKQPMSDENNEIILIYNGEIYNYKELKKKYLSAYPFYSDTDTEVMLHLYKIFGILFINKLKGDFAFAIYDKKLKKIFLARDRFGVKPLYYYFNGNTFFFSSEIKALIKAGITPELNKENLSSFFTFKYVPLNETLFKNIYRVPPSHFIEYDILSNKIKIQRYWELEKNISYKNIPYEDAKNHLSFLLESSIESQLMGDVPIGNFLSGGLDSSTIAYFIKDRKDINHYTARKNIDDLKFEGSSSDYNNAERLSQDWKLNLFPVDIGQGELNSQILSLINYFSDDLIADGSQIPSYLITKYAAKYSKVILSGMGADEYLLGYAGHQISLLSTYLDKTPDVLSGSITTFLSKLETGKGNLKAYKRFLKKFGSYYSKGNTRYGFLNIVGDVDNALSVYSNNSEKVKQIFNDYFNNSNHIFDNINRFEFDNFLVKNLHYIDRMCMANSIEGRVPFLDYELVEFVYSLPLKYKLSAFGKGKKILKDSMRGKLPDYIIDRRKAGFGMPLRAIFSDEKKVNDLLDKKLFSDLGGFSIPDINRVINSHIKGAEDNSALIFSLITFQNWYKLFF